HADPNGFGILVSCVGRKIVMGDDIEDEIDVVKKALGKNSVLAGFYSYGEICPFTGFTECKLHNQTMTITWLSEAA
ncbi:MAG: FIST C-terminal domain-containing protein, partial [Oligoflexus sp.]